MEFGSRDITINLGSEDDGNRVDDTITLTVYSGTVGNSVPEDTLSIEVEDAERAACGRR